MKVLVCKKRVKQGDYTYELMGDYVHINNHKTNDKSLIVPIGAILKLLG